MAAEHAVDERRVVAARRRLAGLVARTPLVGIDGSSVLVKAESLQPSGSFKLRGAHNTLLQVDPARLSAGVVAHSSGNHAVAVATAARVHGVHATIVMPDDAPVVKLDRTRALGAEVEVVGPASSERAARAAELATTGGIVPVEPYDAEQVVEATATIGAEILEQLAGRSGDGGELEVYVPVSGGGLAAGVALAVSAQRRRWAPGARWSVVRVVGVEPEVAADARASLRAGSRVELPAEQMAATCADGLRVAVVGRVPWAYLRELLHDVVTVTEEEIVDTMGRLATAARLVAEPSGAVAPAAALAAERGGPRGVRRVAVLSGGNVDPNVLAAAVVAHVGRAGEGGPREQLA